MKTLAERAHVNRDERRRVKGYLRDERRRLKNYEEANGTPETTTKQAEPSHASQ